MKTQKTEELPKETAEGEVNEVIQQERPKTAFFITPLGSNNSDIRRNTNGIIGAVIRPVLAKLGIELTPPHEIDIPGNITKQIIAQILNADLVIADLTGLNPNVMYELAVRHARRLPVIVIAQYGTTLPFDVAAERAFFYTNDMTGVLELTSQLEKTIPKALSDENPDNPVYSGLDTLVINRLVEKEKDNINAIILEKLGKVDELAVTVRNLVANQNQRQRSNSLTSLLDEYEKKSGMGSDSVKSYRYTIKLAKDNKLSTDQIAARIRSTVLVPEGVAFMTDPNDNGRMLYFDSNVAMPSDLSSYILELVGGESIGRKAYD